MSESQQSEIRSSQLAGTELRSALAYYNVSHYRFCRQTGFTPSRLARTLRRRPGEGPPLPRWVDFVVLAYEQFPELRLIDSPGPLILDEWDLDSDVWITGAEVASVLRRYDVPVERYADHLGRDVRAVRDYLSGIKGPIHGWMIWPLVLYTLNPEVRTADGLLPLPVAKWMT